MLEIIPKNKPTKKVLIDDDDAEKLKAYKWWLNPKGYAYTTAIVDGKRNTLFMHRVINHTPKGLKTDHKNRNRLDNRRHNLRTATSRQNACNAQKSVGVSGYIGVYQINKNWMASLSHEGKQLRFGCFANKRHAAMIRDIWAREIHGEFANLNFPNALTN